MGGKLGKSNLMTNTGHRFISKAKTAYKIHIHTPDDTILHRSVGYIRIGEKAGLKKAIKLRNELGYDMWGKFWKRLLKDPYLMTRLPHSLEPKIVFKPSPKIHDPDFRDECYIAKWKEYREDGTHALKTMVCSIKAHGRLSAYTRTKRALVSANKENLEILKFMGRINENVTLN